MDGLQKKLERVGLLFYSSSALSDYLDVCSAVQTYYQEANAAGGVPPAFSASVFNEISLITTLYETNLKQAKATLSRSINSSSAMVPINSLPTEILALIFHLVVGERPCGVSQNGVEIALPKYPDFLSHVCTRWRQIAVNSPTLWSHIDIVPCFSRSRGFEARTKYYVARAGGSLLDVHISERGFHEDFGMENMFGFLATIAPRIRSLEFVVPGTSEAFDPLLIESCFENCIPGTFTKLSITDNSSNSITCIEAADDPGDIPHSLWLNMPPEVLRTLLLPVTVLQLEGVYFPWTHRVYHGLVELRLTCSRKSARSISDLELVNILVLSPGLRIFYFGLRITRTLSKDSPVFPVRLDDLELLDCTSIRSSQLGTFLRLLSPGSEPLRLSLEPHVAGGRVACGEEVKDFFARSNVSELFINNFTHSTYQMVVELIKPIPNLQVLVMREVCSHPTDSTPNLDDLSTLPTRSRLDVLYMIRARVESYELEQLIRQCPVDKLILRNCRVFDGPNLQSDQELQTTFLRVCPVVRCIGDDEPDLVKSEN